MATSFFSRRDGASGCRKAPTAPRVGHVYLDIQRRMLHCLDDTARQMVQEGIPFTNKDLQRQPLSTLAGDPVKASDLPLHRAWRERSPQEAIFVMAQPGGMQHLSWHAVPLTDEKGELWGIFGSVTVAHPEPDWQDLAGLAHDLRTPLQALRLLVPLLESMPLLHAEAREVLERIRTASDRALSVGFDLLEWCRVPTMGGRRVERTWFPLGPLLSELAAEHLTGAQRKRITLSTDLSEAQTLLVHTDRVRLGRLFSNLLSNAIRYTETGQVRFTATWRLAPDGQPQALILSVVDTGAGISPEDQESIFQPYERGKAGREGDSSSGGSGVGLAVVDRLVQELQLTLEVFSEYGRGSTFELLLPPTILKRMKEEG